MQLRIALCQTDIAWEQPARNLARLEPLVAGADADVVVLPELFATGFTLDPAPVAEAPGGEVVTALRRWAVQYGKAVAGSVAVAEGGRFFNRMYFVTPDGGCARYDKRHLFAPGGESRNYTPGSDRVVVGYRGFRFLLLVCYDLRFPVWSRCRGDYDAILYCASWPAARREAWRTLLHARAVENQCYVAGVNRVGTTPRGITPGIRSSSISKAARWPRPATVSRRSPRRSIPTRWRLSAPNSPLGATRTDSQFTIKM